MIMCTMILIHIECEKGQEINFVRKAIKELANRYSLSLMIGSKDIEPQKSLLERQVKLCAGYDFVVYSNKEAGCSCSIVENIRVIATDEKSEDKPILFYFLENLVDLHGLKRVLIMFSEDVPENLRVTKVALREFEDSILHHYGWLTKKELEGWTYDINTIFEITQAQ